jgi:hypothetical protein
VITFEHCASQSQGSSVAGKLPSLPSMHGHKYLHLADVADNEESPVRPCGVSLPVVQYIYTAGVVLHYGFSPSLCIISPRRASTFLPPLHCMAMARIVPIIRE